MVIVANFVSIDLAGFSIRGNGTGTGVKGSTGTGLNGIVVRNGSISNFSNGLFLEPTLGDIVEQLRVFNNTEDGIAADGIVRNNTVSKNGIGIAGIGVVTGNQAVSNGTGINGSGIVSGNDAEFNKTIGIIVSSGSTLIGNTVANNNATTGSTGMFVGCPSNLSNNTVVFNSTNLVLKGQGCQQENNLAP